MATVCLLGARSHADATAPYKRFARWEGDGTWAQIEAALRMEPDGAGELDWDAQVDSSIVRAHQHAAGARKGGSARSRQAASKRWGGHGVG
jgi:transposase